MMVSATHNIAPTTQQKPDRLYRFGVGALAVLISMTIAWTNLDQGWFPHDEGQLGQAAERVLQGELPHRDFDDMYSGGLSFLNALSFLLWGASSNSMRFMLFVWFIPFVIAIYWLALQFSKPWVAGLVTLLAAAWSIPMYSAPMPSWYNLFFATWSLCAMVGYFKTDQRRYLFLTGLLIGMSIIFKVSGIFVLAAVMLSVFYRHQERFRGEDNSSAAYSILATIGLLLAGTLSLSFVNSQDYVAHVAHLVIPFLGLTSLVIYNEWTSARGRFRQRMWSDLTSGIALIIGVAIPVVGLVSVYYFHGAVGELIQGTMIQPKQRFAFATAPFPRINNFIFVLPLAALVFPVIGGFKFEKQNQRGLTIFVAVICAILFALQRTPFGYTIAFQSVRNMAPVLVLGNLILIFRFREMLSDFQRQHLFLFTAVAFFVSLIQYPFAVPIYFFYAAPLLLITALLSTQFQRSVPRPALAVIVLFLLLFSCVRYHSHLAVMCLNPKYYDFPEVMLDSERSRIRVGVEDAVVYNRLNTVIKQNSTKDETILATPDAPFVPFMSQRRAFNGVMYEFFREGIYSDLESVRQQLDDRQINLVVINESPSFSKKVTEEFRAIALAEYQLLETISFERDGMIVPTFTVYKRKNPLVSTP